MIATLSEFGDLVDVAVVVVVVGAGVPEKIDSVKYEQY
jgi:hypothetical protein